MSPDIRIKTISPKVISASRATDIPAFHYDWFMERLREGYCEWQNPFNANQRQIVSFANTEAIVFWSKNPAPLMKYLEEIADMGKKFYFQFTLNDYVEEKLEAGVGPDLEERLKVFKDLARNYKVIWRYDPIIMGDTLTINRHLQKIEYLMKNLAESTDKLVFSFVDLYGTVARNLKGHNSELRAPSPDEMEEFSWKLVELREKVAPHLQLATCAEADIDFAKMGIQKNSCIDPALINEICAHEVFPKSIKKKSHAATQLNLLGQPRQNSPLAGEYEKDKGQREACQCAPSKDIGSYRLHPCGHHCVYCYAHHARKHKAG